ncbi:MAG: VWA domain-containing protein [Bryobacteraceae bacterium]|nr:VWA domain-containing protein [Bryobacteraceae bacterium]
MIRRLIALTIVAGLLVAQEKSDITFKAEANLVVVNVIVRDKSGKPLTGLKKEDFALMENGKPQSVSVFEFQELSNEVLPPAPPESAEASLDAAEPPKPEPEGRERFRDRRLMILFFDFAGMEISDQLRAQDSALKFVNEKLAKSDLVQIMSFSSGIRTDQEFTDDRTKLLAALKKFRIGEGLLPGTDAALSDPNAEETGETATTTPEEIELDLFNTDRKLGALEQAVRLMATLPEKKALIYFSSGAGGSGAENQAQLRATVNAAVRANVSFYPVDVRGLVATPPGGGAGETGAKGNALYTGKAQRVHRDKHAEQQETLNSLAADTGGKALLDNNDLGLGIQQAQKDLQSYYTLGYYSTDGSRDGRFRKVGVKLTNTTLQARLDFRAGYYGEKVWTAFNSSDKERQLQEALMLGDPQTGLPLALEVNWFRLNPTKFFVPIAVRIPGSAIDPERKSTEFDFIGQVRDSKGKIAASVRDAIKLKLPANATAEDMKKRNVLYDTGFTLPPGAYKAKFLVRENASGRMGTFETKFTIPEQPVISSVVWSSQREPLNAALASVEKNKKILANHPLIKDGQKLVPSVTRLFRAGQKLYVYVEAYDAQGQTAATVSLFKGNTKVMESEPVLAAAADAVRAGTSPLQFQIPLDGVRPGRYVAQVSVVDAVGHKFSYERTALVVSR